MAEDSTFALGNLHQRRVMDPRAAAGIVTSCSPTHTLVVSGGGARSLHHVGISFWDSKFTRVVVQLRMKCSLTVANHDF